MNDGATAAPANQFDMFAVPAPVTNNGAGPPPAAFNGAAFNPTPMQFSPQQQPPLQPANPAWNNSAPPGQSNTLSCVKRT